MTPALWQRPRPAQPPADFAVLLEQLHVAIAAIGMSANDADSGGWAAAIAPAARSA